MKEEDVALPQFHKNFLLILHVLNAFLQGFRKLLRDKLLRLDQKIPFVLKMRIGRRAAYAANLREFSHGKVFHAVLIHERKTLSNSSIFKFP